MTLTLVILIVLIIFLVVLGLGVFGVIPMGQVGINRLLFTLLATLTVLYAVGTYIH